MLLCCRFCGLSLKVAVSKPAPDIFLLALDQLNQKLGNGDLTPSTHGYSVPASGWKQLLPQNCLVFEDAPTGVEAGLAAGMQVMLIADAAESCLASPSVAALRVHLIWTS
jgi:beta-phosphoglucomutase-like phosphatase (HAD superfamily)